MRKNKQGLELYVSYLFIQLDDARLLLKRKSGRQSGNRSRVTKQQQQRNNLKFTSTYRKMNCAVAFELAVGYF